MPKSTRSDRELESTEISPLRIQSGSTQTNTGTLFDGAVSDSDSATSQISGFSTGYILETATEKSLTQFKTYYNTNFYFAKQPNKTAILKPSPKITLTLSVFLEQVKQNFLIDSRKISPKNIERILNIITGYLNLIIDDLEESALNGALIEGDTHNLRNLFSNYLTAFLKIRRELKAPKEEIFPDASGSSADSSAASLQPIISLPFNSKGHKLLTLITHNKLYLVTEALQNNPTLALQQDSKKSILTDAAFKGKEEILRQVILAINKTPGALIYHCGKHLSDDEKATKLPPVLWAALGGSYPAVEYLLSLPEVTETLRLDPLQEIIKEISDNPGAIKDAEKILELLQSQKERLIALNPMKKVGDEPIASAPKIPEFSIGAKKLIKAIKNGDHAAVVTMLKENPSLATECTEVKSTLSEAIKAGDCSIVAEVAFHIGPDYNFAMRLRGERDNEWLPPLLTAALSGQYNMVRYLLEFCSLSEDIKSSLPSEDTRKVMTIMKKRIKKEAVPDDELKDYEATLELLEDFYYKRATAYLPHSPYNFLHMSYIGGGMLKFFSESKKPRLCPDVSEKTPDSAAKGGFIG